jgi:hypothetical protein
MGAWTIISISISILSVLIAIWQIWKQHKLNEYIKAESMELYSNSSVMLGNIQTALENVRNNNLSVAIQNAGQAEGLCQALFMRAIKNIYILYRFKEKDIDKWIKNGKIKDHHKTAFVRFIE